MNDKPNGIKKQPGSKTGVMPRLDLPSNPQESLQPPTLPEMEDLDAGITGVIQINLTEGEDEAKNAADDTEPQD